VDFEKGKNPFCKGEKPRCLAEEGLRLISEGKKSPAHMTGPIVPKEIPIFPQTSSTNIC
jgi:hypothetical protein